MKIKSVIILAFFKSPNDIKGSINRLEKGNEDGASLLEVKDQNAKFHEKLYKLNRTMNLLSKTVEKITKKVNLIATQSTVIHDKVVDSSKDGSTTGK